MYSISRLLIEATIKTNKTRYDVMQFVCMRVFSSLYMALISCRLVLIPERDGDRHSFNYRKLTTLFDVFCLQGEKGDVGNVGKTGPQVSCNSCTCLSLEYI